jgi:hypothetical protein
MIPTSNFSLSLTKIHVVNSETSHMKIVVVIQVIFFEKYR